MKTHTNTIPATLSEVLKPLIDFLKEDPSGENPIGITEMANLTGFPNIDPNVAALFSPGADNLDPVLERLESLIKASAIPNGPSREMSRAPILSQYCAPIHFALIGYTTGLVGELSPEYFLLAEIVTEDGDLAGAERQVGLLVERLRQTK
jgi:hypothetical protein